MLAGDDDFNVRKDEGGVMQTGENDQAMRKILDMTRLISIAVLAIHFYKECYGAFAGWHWVTPLSDRILENIVSTGLFNNFYKSKLIALGFLVIALIGVKGKKSKEQNFKTAGIYLLAGFVFYFISGLVLMAKGEMNWVTIGYMGLTTLGYLLFLSGGTMLSRIIRDKLKDDIFNTENETFPQEERLIENEYSVNLPARYRLREKTRNSYINFINMFRALLVLGSPGSTCRAKVISLSGMSSRSTSGRALPCLSTTSKCRISRSLPTIPGSIIRTSIKSFPNFIRLILMTSPIATAVIHSTLQPCWTLRMPWNQRVPYYWG
ncbi:MAG: conjugal transfer protein TraG [Mucilaginibacter sp.]|nr:conjugal transfer protein TraG [Mucilaginibacter sp.]